MLRYDYAIGRKYRRVHTWKNVHKEYVIKAH